MRKLIKSAASLILIMSLLLGVDISVCAEKSREDNMSAEGFYASGEVLVLYDQDFLKSKAI